MIILKTLSDEVGVFYETELYILNQRNPLRKERLFLALGMMLFACIGILLQPDDTINLFLKNGE
jgi:hypothetical protein